jgi:Domain of unknown function (DUF4388)
MALRGTLGDFGLPDIFQLVGHQQKTGVLLLKDRELEVRIYFVEGNVVKAEQSSRDKSELLGNIMLRAGAMTNSQLEQALEAQQRTLRRLGDVLIEMGAVDRATLKEFARLQTTETIYRLFFWKKGTYEFTAAPVDYDDQSYEPIRAENILMEGFRMVDEWPAVRKVVPSSQCTFQILKTPPAAAKNESDDDDLLAGMDAALGDDSGEIEVSSSGKKIGAGERRVFPLVNPTRTVQDIIDLSRMGEFETSKALAGLVQGGFLRVLLPSVVEKSQDEPMTLRRAVSATTPIITRVALYAVVAAAVGGLVRLGAISETGLLAKNPELLIRRDAVREAVANGHAERITHAVETYRLLEGRLPEKLDVLVDAGLLTKHDLSFPFERPFAYRVDGASWRLALPLR